MTRPKLLLADDSVTIRKVVELTFADEGIDVTAVADSDTAMQKFVEIQPDIVLVDVGLSGISGYRICEMIKHDEATSHIPVLLLVGSFEPFDQDEAERAGADGFLTKPFHSIRDLVSQVSDLLGRDASTSEPLVGDANAGAGPDETTSTGEMLFEDSIDLPEPFPLEPSQTDATPWGDAAPFGQLAVEETSDIDKLYQSSFAETVEIDELDTVEDILGDAGMDDEMIEATYPDVRPAENVVDFVPAAQRDETTKEFDWSPESLIAETETLSAQASRFEPKFVFEDFDDKEITVADGSEHTVADEVESDSGTSDPETTEEPEVEKTPDSGAVSDPFDSEASGERESLVREVETENARDETFGSEPDERVSEPESVVAEFAETASEPDAGSSEPEAAVSELEAALSELAETFPEPDTASEGLESTEPAPVLTVSEPESLETVHEAKETEPDATGPDTMLRVSDEDGPTAQAPDSNGDGKMAEPSPELIAMIAERVLEKLSDRVIREVAVEAVPRIAEKLIREALEGDRRS